MQCSLPEIGTEKTNGRLLLKNIMKFILKLEKDLKKSFLYLPISHRWIALCYCIFESIDS